VDGAGDTNSSGGLGGCLAFAAWRLEMESATGTWLPLPLGMQQIDR